MMVRNSRSLALISILIGQFLHSSEMATRSNLFDIRDKNISLSSSPNPVSSCLNDLAVIGETTTIYRNSEAQPYIAVNPLNKKEVVAVFEQDVVGSTATENLGALSIGVTYSYDGGKTWNYSDSLVTQLCSGGFADTVSNIWINYGSNEKVYLTATFSNISLNPNTLNQSGVFVSVSSDNGKNWSFPIILDASSHYVNEPTQAFPLISKATITVDPNDPDNLYAVWSRSADGTTLHSDAIFSKSTDAGLTWSANAVLYNPFTDTQFATINNGIANNMSVTNNRIVILPDGNLLNFMTRTYAAPGTTNPQFVNDVWPYQYRLFDIAFTRSTNGGTTWNLNATPVVSIDGNNTFTGGYTYDCPNITGGVGAQTSTLGSNQFFDVAVNPDNSYLYVVYQSGEFTPAQLPQVALVSSRDSGITWSDSVRVSRTSFNAPNPQAFTPSVTVAEGNVVGIMYYDFRKSDTSIPTTSTNTKTNVWFAQYKETVSSSGGSTGIGLDFLNEVLVSKHSYNIQTGPTVYTGLLTNGNYAGATALHDDFYITYIKANNILLIPAQVLVDDTNTGTVLFLDNNKRTSAYFSRIDTKK